MLQYAQNVRHQRLHKLADASCNSRSTCRLRLVVTRPRSSQALTSVPGCPSPADLFTKQNDVIVTSLLSWYSVAFSICKQHFDR